MKKMMFLLTALSFLIFVGTASAVPISEGGISFSSQAGCFFYTDTTVDFCEAGAVDEVTGDFASYFATGDTVTFYDFAYDSDGPTTVPQLRWSGTGSLDPSVVSFTLTSVTYSAVSPSGSTITFEGFGVISNSVDESDGFWSFTANEAGDTFSFSSSAAPVPEPGILLLLGTGLAGLALYRRRSTK